MNWGVSNSVTSAHQKTGFWFCLLAHVGCSFTCLVESWPTLSWIPHIFLKLRIACKLVCIIAKPFKLSEKPFQDKPKSPRKKQRRTTNRLAKGLSHTSKCSGFLPSTVWRCMKYVDACVMRKLHYHAGTLLKMGTPGNYRQPVTTLALPKVPELTSVNVPRDQSHRFLEGEMRSDLWFEGGNCAAAFFFWGGRGPETQPCSKSKHVCSGRCSIPNRNPVMHTE